MKSVEESYGSVIATFRRQRCLIAEYNPCIFGLNIRSIPSLMVAHVDISLEMTRVVHSIGGHHELRSGVIDRAIALGPRPALPNCIFRKPSQRYPPIVVFRRLCRMCTGVLLCALVEGHLPW